MNSRLKSKNNLVFLFFISAVSIFIISAAVWFMQCNCFLDDDEHYALINGLKYSDIFKSLQFNEHGGGYFGYFLCKFMCFLVPIKLGIHPADYLCSPLYNAVKGCFIVLILLFMSKFAVFYHKSRLLFASAFFFLSNWLIYVFFSTIYSIFYYNYNFYRYFFSIIFFSYLIYFILKNINAENKSRINAFELTAACLCAYVTGTSSEMLFIPAVILYIFLFILKTAAKNFKINKRIFIPFIFLIIAACLFISSEGFQETAHYRGFLETNITLDYLFDFSKYYFIIYFKNYFIYWLVCAVSIALTLLYCPESRKNLIFPALFQISVLISYFSLILCADESPYQSNGCTYFLGHANLIFLFFMIMTIPLFLYLSNIFENFKAGRKMLYGFIFCILICLSAAVFSNHLFKTLPFEINNQRQINYKADKLFRFQALKGQKPVIPYSFIKERSTMWFNDTLWCDYTYYFAWVYGDKSFIGTKFTVDKTDETLNRFLSEGGVFTDEELKNINFTRLKDDDFVLNKK